MSSRALAVTVSGDSSKCRASVSMTLPIWSTSRLTAPSSVRTTTFIGSWPSGRGPMPRGARGSGGGAHDDVQRERPLGTRLHAEPVPQVQRGDDLAAQVVQAADGAGGERD